MKKMFEVYNTYGKSSGDEISFKSVLEDTQENRQSILDGINTDYPEDSIEDFLNGKINSIGFYLDGGDWDEPTGCYVLVKTKEQLIQEIQKKLDKIEKDFE